MNKLVCLGIICVILSVLAGLARIVMGLGGNPNGHFAVCDNANSTSVLSKMCKFPGQILGGMPVDSQSNTNRFTNFSFYINSTDNHVHLRGLLTNILHETRYGTGLGFSIYFDPTYSATTIEMLLI